MKTFLTLFCLTLTTSSFARILLEKDGLYIETSKGKNSIFMVNKMIKEDSISQLKMYGNGRAHLISFSKNKGPSQLYSVDAKGYIYAIKPFTNFSISNVDDHGKFQFFEMPGRKYSVNEKGFFLY